MDAEALAYVVPASVMVLPSAAPISPLLLSFSASPCPFAICTYARSET